VLVEPTRDVDRQALPAPERRPHASHRERRLPKHQLGLEPEHRVAEPAKHPVATGIGLHPPVVRAPVDFDDAQA